MSLSDRSAHELLALLERGDLTAAALAERCLDRIAHDDRAIGAFLRVDREAVLAQAERIDARRRAGQPLGRLAGLPVAVKDLLCAAGEPMTCASRMLESYRPPFDATVIARLRAADAVLLGRTNMDEFAMGSSNEHSAFHLTRNPWDLSCIAGGSSGGSAAAVAARLAPLAIGSDTGGSIRQPACHCGVVGMKPTYGRVSRLGLVAFASSLDQIGPLATTVEDAALLLETIAGHDPQDSTSLDKPVPPWSETVRQPLKGLRLGVIREHFSDGLDAQVEAAVREAIEVYRWLGATIREVSLPHSRFGVAAYYIIAPCEASSNLARYDGVHYGYRSDEATMLRDLAEERRALEAAGDTAALDELDTPLVRLFRRTRAEGFGPEVKRRIMLGTYALSAGYYDAYYKKALQVRRLIREDFDRVFAEVDLLIGPLAPTPAFPIGEKADDPLSIYLLDLYTVGTNLAGIAGISVPCGFDGRGLPIGLHLQAPPLEEDQLFRGAWMFQNATDWHTRQPSLHS